jgi:hypothetical protein
MANNLVYVDMAFLLKMTHTITFQILTQFMQNIMCIHVTSSLFYMLTIVGYCLSGHLGHTPRTLNGSFPCSLSETLRALHDSSAVIMRIPLEHHIIV